MYKAVLFDLDGTLTKPESGVFKSIEYIANKLNFALPPKSELRNFIGPPVQLSFQKYFGVSKSQSEEVALEYRKYYQEHGLLDCELFSGVEEMLSLLNSAGIKLLVATSKPQKFAEAVLNKFNLIKYFYKVCGAGFSEKAADKSLIVKNAVAFSGERIEDILMVGDRKYDVIGANDSNIKCLGVLYGYGTKEELILAGAIQTAETPKRVAQLIIEGSV
ncbi:MAG: HAD hydrolase-like protein [Clostridia bacterium]|nr:HAD hydrolase-like protein [Clostridia bacterium]